MSEMTPGFADPAAPARPLHALTPQTLQAWMASRPAPEQAWLSAAGFEAALGEIRLLPGADGGVAGAVLGLGTAADRARSRFGAVKSVAGLPAGAWALQGEIAQSLRSEIALGWLLASYRFDRYRPGKSQPEVARLVAPDGVDGRRLLEMARAEFLTRDLINTPAGDLGPAELEAAFLALAARHGAATQVLRGEHLAAGFPLVHAVGRASPRAPRILELRWGAEGPALTLVGKGVCFDTGGLNIKSGSGMGLMKKDMGGAATVMGLAQMIMALGLRLRLRVIVPAVENVIAGNALKPKDILTSRKGLTVEVNDTDAEGRLILADALAWADAERPDLILSMATLTGAARVAVGPDLAPFYADSDADAAALMAGAAAGFDPVWRLPFHAPYETVIEPGIADLDNAPGWGFAGSVTAALFLHRFVEHARYLHFDIYGHTPADAPARPKGGVGQGARAVLEALPAMLGL